MAREILDNGLTDIKHEVMYLGNMVVVAVNKSLKALIGRDFSTSLMIIEEDQIINQKRYAIEHQCLTLIATQQPLASDLRILASVLEIIMELERMGDYAKGIGKINILLGKETLLPVAQILPEMAHVGLKMLAQSLDAFLTVDIELSNQITAEDNVVDALYNRVYRDLINEIIKDPSAYDRVNYTLWAAHDLERMADRVMNICERTIFIHTGEVHEFGSEMDEIMNPKWDS
ncbi:MAG: phosphate signaling complex protein PhoU [Anaerolineaceae bacterium]|nr:phosphate signaling complex protein PhoU [Anaerolineaceae bacterium]